MMKITIFDFSKICFKIMKKYHFIMKKRFQRAFDKIFGLVYPDDHKNSIFVQKCL